MYDLRGFKECLDFRRYDRVYHDRLCMKFRFKENLKLFLYAVRFKQDIGFGESYFNNTTFTVEDKSIFLPTSSKSYEGLSEEEFISLLLQKKKDLNLEACENFKLPFGFKVLEISPFYVKSDNQYREKLLEIL